MSIRPCPRKKNWVTYRWAEKADIRALYRIYRVLEGICAEIEDDLKPHLFEVFRVSLAKFRKEIAMSKVGQQVIGQEESQLPAQ